MTVDRHSDEEYAEAFRHLADWFNQLRGKPPTEHEETP